MNRSLKALAVALACVLLATACGGGEPDRAAPSGQADQLAPQVASYDLAVGKQRFLVGVLSQETELIGGGEVDLKFAYLGTRQEQTSGDIVSEQKATFLPIPPEAGAAVPEVPDRPSIVAGRQVNGVYSTEATFDRPGFWGVVVEADVEGEGRWTGRTTFQVNERHQFPWIGEEAPKSENLTLTSTDAPRSAIDSRARDGKDVPDPELHGTTVAAAVASGKPTLLVVSTPTYCVSRFCGPVTDMVQGLAKDYAGQANFVHVEVWRDFEKQEVNRSAAEWTLRGDNILEPWVFLIGPDGKISSRWDNVATRSEVEPALKELQR
ncbi:MAG TPA: hypothetical protein VHJ78_12805 [Actinomycetota bacterium]|nr:hypothetical protein [Actinomycetota bacterium]